MIFDPLLISSNFLKDEDLVSWNIKHVSRWVLKRCLWPRKCAVSGKRLWGKIAYRGVRLISGPGDPITLVFWVDKNEYLLWKIKNA